MRRCTVACLAFLLTISVMIAVSASAQISVGPSVVDLGTVQVGFADTAPLTVVNTGGGIVSVTDITSDDPQFTVSPTEFTLAAGANSVVTVTFTPTFVGLETATLTVSDDGGGSTSAGASGIGSMVIIPRTGDLLNDTKIAFESDLDGDWDIYTMLPDGSAVTPLTVNADLDIHPA